MKIGGAFGVAAAFLAWAACAPAMAAPGAPLDEALRTIRQTYDRGDYSAALSMARHTLDDRSNPPSGDALMELNNVIVDCEYRAKDMAKMYRDAMRATASEPSSIYVWRMRLGSEYNSKHYDAALTTITLMAQSHRAALNATPIRLFDALHALMKNAGDRDTDFRMLKILNDAYQPIAPFAEVEDLRLAYARQLYDANDKAAAVNLINGIQTFSGLVEVSTDPDLRALQDPKVNLQLAAERQLVEDQITLSQHPDILEGVTRVAGDLRRLGRYQDALAVLEKVRPRIGTPNGFSDRDYQQGSWWEGLATTYVALGDYDHAIESYRAGIGSGEFGQRNVSQVLDSALEQMRFGHYEDALVTLAAAPDKPGERSPYGEMVFHYAHGCAAWLAGHKQDAAKDIAYVTVHERDGPGNAVALSLCVGDLDAAAAHFIRDLNDPDERAGALEHLADFLPNAANVPEPPADKVLTQLKARADVKAAIEKAGGIPSFPFRRDDL
ncbi:MAG TPA: hypothetical protein VK533_01230 [Sphingomonas sp.]|uniref:hypothetical protein n=1 Tax=Sphingomonas sp. TaxID=28214 RepID=UPI002CCA98C3|nr:hypothetical protein [Sphingomonas sp.]HMI18143.1 hypothetical protein [Sphingomonas sp.]